MTWLLAGVVACAAQAVRAQSAGCVSGTATWVSTPMSSQADAFTVEFDATPSHDAVDGVIGLSGGSAIGYTRYAATVRFNAEGYIDARSALAFVAASPIRYTGGVTYHIRMDVNVPTRSYSVYVTPPAGSEQVVAEGILFRTEQWNTTELDHWGMRCSSGALTVCNFVEPGESANQFPVARFTADPSSGPAPLRVSFDGSSSSDADGSIVEHRWSFGDGRTGTGPKTSRLFPAPGSYRVTLTVVDDQGATASAVTHLEVGQANQTPQAAAVASVTSGAAPLLVTLDATGSLDVDGNIASYAWDYGDGTQGTGPKTTKLYAKPGTYQAAVTVTDDKGAIDMASLTITAEDETACASISNAWQSYPIGTFDDLMTAEFDVTPLAPALDGLNGLSFNPASWYTQLAVAIRFNMANTIDARNGDTYAAVSPVGYTPGSPYHVRLVVDVPAKTYDAFVTPGGGPERQIAAGFAFRTEQSAVASLNTWTPVASFGSMDVCNFTAKAVARNKSPIATGTISPTTGQAPLSIQCNAAGSSDPDGTIVAYTWDFGDGTQATGPQASHTYTSPGQYAVVLKVTDDGGATATKQFALSASPPPGACLGSNGTWQNNTMPAQQGAFSVEFDATPNAAYMDGGLALATGPIADYSGAAAAVRFNTAGLIDARDGGAYTSDETMPYSAGESYHFRLTVSVPARAYSVYVTPSGGAEMCIAENYAFRTEQMNVTSLATWAMWATSTTQTHQVCNFKLGPPPAPGLAVGTRSLDFGLYSTNLPVEIWNSGGSSLSYSVASNAGWLTVSPKSGSSTGERDTITATVNRTGLAAGTYQGTITVTPSTGAAITIAVVMQYGTVPQTKLTPIARWDTVPYQRLNTGSTLNVGVVAFSKYGISRVRFTVSGQGYTGPSPIDVTEMTLNPQTGVYEYWTPIAASKFATDGAFTIDAAVYGNDGGYRDRTTGGGGVGLDRLQLIVNATGNLVQPQAWVSPGGSDSTGAVNDSTRPFKSIGKAIDKIRSYRGSIGAGNNADGGIIRLTAGTHACSDGGAAGPIACENEWLTITTAAGATRANTILAPGGIVATRKIALRGITLKGGGTIGMGYNDRIATQVWADDCTIIGSGRGITTSHPLSSEYAALYYTGCTITEVHQATSGSKLCRGLTITRISDDAFQNVPAIYNCTVDDVDPLSTGAHADVWQHGGGNASNKIDDNVIVYNLRATNLKYQSLFIRPDIYSAPSYAQGMAFVNVYMQMRSDSHGWGGWYRWVDHLLWWHCSFTVKGMGIMPDTYAGTKRNCSIRNMSVRGCDFAFLGIGGSDADVDYSDWQFNHFTNGSLTRGTHVTTGTDSLDTFGVPSSVSPLLDKFAPIVPVDARNQVRSGQADVGAYER